jgi:hypothetical protein
LKSIKDIRETLGIQEGKGKFEAYHFTTVLLFATFYYYYFLAVLELELRASCLLGRHSQRASGFCSGQA